MTRSWKRVPSARWPGDRWCAGWRRTGSDGQRIYENLTSWGIDSRRNCLRRTMSYFSRERWEAVDGCRLPLLARYTIEHFEPGCHKSAARFLSITEIMSPGVRNDLSCCRRYGTLRPKNQWLYRKHSFFISEIEKAKANLLAKSTADCSSGCPAW